MRVVARGLQPPVVEAERLRPAHIAGRARHRRPCRAPAAVSACASSGDELVAIEELAGIGRAGHARRYKRLRRSRQPDDRASCALVGAVGRAADQHEAPVAIAAIDIALLVDLQEHARMAERRAAGNVGRAVAGDAGMGDADDFGRRQHGCAIASAGGRINLLALAKRGAPPHHDGMIRLFASPSPRCSRPVPPSPRSATKPAPAKPTAAKPAAKPKPTAAKPKPKTR